MLNLKKYLKNEFFLSCWKKKTEVLAALSLVFVFGFLLSVGLQMKPGSYANGQYYSMNITQEKLIRKIDSLKIMCPQYKFIQKKPDGSIAEVKDHYSNKFYHAYFYMPDKNLVWHCVIKAPNENNAKIGLYGVSNTNFAFFRKINTKELTKEQNAEFKKIFEERVLSFLLEKEN